jgi:hypothetical protein
MRHLTDVKHFYSDKDLSRLDYLIKSFLIICIIAAAHLLYNVRFPHRHTSLPLQLTFDVIVGGLLLFWMLSKKIVTQITLDFKNKIFIAHYITISGYPKTEVPFEFLTFACNKVPANRQSKGWTLNVYNRKKNVFSIETGQDGFAPETLDELVDDLKKIQATL